MSKALAYGAAFLMVAVLVFNIAAVAGTGWVKLSTDGGYIEYGIWRQCAYAGGQSQCADTTCPDSSTPNGDRICTDLKLIRGTMIVAIIDGFVAFLFLGYALYTKDTSKRGILNMIITALLGFVAMCAAADLMVKMKDTLGDSGFTIAPYWSFGLCVAGWILAVIATALWIVGSKSLGQTATSTAASNSFQPLAPGA